MKGYSATEAIYAKCLDCCCDDVGEVRRCEITQCPLYPWHSKVVKHRVVSDEEREKLRERAKHMHKERGE